jgi:ParB family chromosome partitioning protein
LQAIKVRPLKPGGEFKYEVVFGHRRHRACLELGLPVLAVVDNLGGVELFVQMDRENRSRKNLSAWEQGMMYLRALENGLFPSNRQLAEKVGVDRLR